VTARILAMVCAGQEAAAFTALPTLASLARADLAQLRVAYFRTIPPPRRDGWDRIVRHTDSEMARITRAITETFRAALRRFDDVDSDVVVRFGTPHLEAAIEADAFEPVFAAVCSPADAGWRERLRASRLRRYVAVRAGVRVLVLQTPPPARRRDTTLIREAWRTHP